MDDELNLTDKIDIISTEDERLKVIGEILSADSSRKILQLLFNKSFTANQIAQKTGMSLPLVLHHLKKMQSVGVVKITSVGKNTKSHDMKFYTIDKVALVILPTEMKSPAKKSKSLFNSFTRIHRLATLGGVSAAAWFSSQLLQKSSVTIEQSQTGPGPMAWQAGSDSSADEFLVMEDTAETEPPAATGPPAPEPPTTMAGQAESDSSADEFLAMEDTAGTEPTATTEPPAPEPPTTMAGQAESDSHVDESLVVDYAAETGPTPQDSEPALSTSFVDADTVVAVTGEPSMDIIWSVIILAGIIAAWAVIEVAIKHRVKKTA